MGNLVLATASAPSTPSSGYATIYVKSSDKQLYWKDDAGVERPVAKAIFESSEQAVATGTTINTAHSLGRVPYRIQVILRCKTAELNYSIGDEVEVSGWHYNDATLGIVGNTIVCDATNVTIVCPANTPRILDKSTVARNVITAGNWKYVLRAW